MKMMFTAIRGCTRRLSCWIRKRLRRCRRERRKNCRCAHFNRNSHLIIIKICRPKYSAGANLEVLSHHRNRDKCNHLKSSCSVTKIRLHYQSKKLHFKKHHLRKNQWRYLHLERSGINRLLINSYCPPFWMEENRKKIWMIAHNNL